jgi:predicted O-methyltransferase YrrM
MALPKALRRLAPDSVRHSGALRGAALRARLIPPRTMHTDGESALLAELADGRGRVVEVGVYEGSSALVLVDALPLDAELHLVEPFGVGPWPGVMNAPDERAAVAVVGRAARRRGGPSVIWHVAFSEQAAAGWAAPVDLVFVDGDHSEDACRRDWELWHPFVEPGGVVAFHDARAGKPAGWGDPGPTAVVDELFRDGGGAEGWEIAAERDTVVAVRRR